MLIGHKELLSDLKALADRGALPHGYIFFGPARVGKATSAKKLAHYLESGAEEGDGPVLGDLLLIEPKDGAIGIDPIREVRGFLSQRPNRSKYRTAIIDGADELTDEAQNALLKIAEEPPVSAFIVLVSQDPERLRPTLQSRFQKLYFAPAPAKEIENWLVKEKKIPAEKAKKAAEASCGAPGLAYAFLEDEKLQELVSQAKKFLGSAGPARKEFLKELVAEETFSLYRFLEAVLIALGPNAKKDPEFYHALCDLRRQASYFNLNPRLQLLALSEKLR